MEDAIAPRLLAAVRILAREGTLDARLDAFAREARTVSGGVTALTLLRDADAGTFATPAGEPLDLDAAALGVLRDAAEERRAAWSTSLPDGLARLAGATQGCIVPLMTADGTGPVVQGVLLVAAGMPRAARCVTPWVRSPTSPRSPWSMSVCVRRSRSAGRGRSA